MVGGGCHAILDGRDKQLVESVDGNDVSKVKIHWSSVVADITQSLFWQVSDVD